MSENGKPSRIPLDIYIGGIKKISGEAEVTESHFKAFVDSRREPELTEIVRLIENGIIQNVAVVFNAPPATPVLKDGHARWEKNF
jgi:hypothetical protein